MKLPTEIFSDVIVVHTPEELGEDLAERIRDFLTSQERSKVIVDLDSTESVDSEGLTALLDAQDVLRQTEGDLKIFTTNQVNRKILEITRVDRQLEVYESVIDAVKGFV